MTKPVYAPIGTIRHYPEKWYSGPDYDDHQKYYAWLKHRSQALYRGEGHTLTWRKWLELWPEDVWIQRGKQRTDLCLTRPDPELAWSDDNCEIITRQEQFNRQGLAKRGKLRGPNKPKLNNNL
jgi:hypothetical protein